MTILHYTLGLAPQRSGGLTKYATDLMIEQSKRHHVALLFPSTYIPLCRDIKFTKEAKYQNIDCYGLKNTSPIPLLYGIKSPQYFISRRKMSLQQMSRLYETIKPDIFHVHTLMGLPKELLEYLKSNSVKLIFTSHDYFGICPRVNLIDNNSQICHTPSASKCKECNSNAPSSTWLRARNSQLALNIKNKPVS